MILDDGCVGDGGADDYGNHDDDHDDDEMI